MMGHALGESMPSPGQQRPNCLACWLAFAKKQFIDSNTYHINPYLKAVLGKDQPTWGLHLVRVPSDVSLYATRLATQPWCRLSRQELPPQAPNLRAAPVSFKPEYFLRQAVVQERVLGPKAVKRKSVQTQEKWGPKSTAACHIRSRPPSSDC